MTVLKGLRHIADDWPALSDGPWRKWHIPAQCWSSAEYGEDTIRIFHNIETGEWWGDTEHDQNTHRDLSAKEVAQVREEFQLQP